MTTIASQEFSEAERLKFDLLADGLAISDDALVHLRAATSERELTPADYATTSGLILVLGDDVWVNAPIAEHNPNFVAAPRHQLALDGDRLVVRTRGVEVPAQFWLPPAFHDDTNEWGETYTSYAFTHTDRVRVAPVEGCAMTCKFCDLPYEFRYRTKRIAGVVDALTTAFADPIQPAAHVLVSGGTPRPEDYDYVLDVYHAVLDAAPDRSVDIMMVPIPQVLPLADLDDRGLGEVSMNIELFGREAARKYMRRKFDQGLNFYLASLEHAASILGGSRVRSMLLVGLEPVDDTLAGVEAIASSGCVPVLSPFRPDGSTPLKDHPAPSADLLADVYLRSREITQALGVDLGPACIPCSHNTLTLANSGCGDASIHHGRPVLI